MKKITYKIALAIVVVVFTSCCKQHTYQSADEIVDEMKVGLDSISVNQLKEKIDNMESYFILIDVREANEHIYGFIPGSINICAGTILFKMENETYWEDQMMYPPEKEDEIIVYCKKGKRSVVAANYLHMLGYKNVKYVVGGWKNWEMNYPLLYEKNLEAAGHVEVSDEGGC